MMDGTWALNILVTDLQVERSVRVHGEDHVGGVMIKLVDILDIAMDWSDHALWWPANNMWLHKTRWTLEQYNLTADHCLEFTPMHKRHGVYLGGGGDR
ncbi:fermitin family homolog 2 [Eurytemora carolleeae]|uniref:fermitin family homolog 2 n=1 Tax=Eurytemora carolleeae TaxID=1294199 RepID=UPI000C758CB2|nr:fermitin family homolog 2 [Eurytemora carolleeae]|eukprot:XP_023343357.1 fermitin family homolog 2-like [Eurytemora affinis]